MANISRLFMRQLSNEELNNVFGRIASFVEVCFGDKANELASEFLNAAKTFNLAVRRSLFSTDGILEDADSAADKAWYLLYWQFKISLDHPSEYVRAAAQAVFEVFSQIPNPTQLPFAEEYAEIKKLLEALEALPKELLEQASVDFWVHNLRTCYNNFMTASETIEAVRVMEAAGSIKQCRVNVCDAYLDLAQRIKTLSEISPNKDIDEFISQINFVIEQSNQNAFNRMNGWDRMDIDNTTSKITSLENA